MKFNQFIDKDSLERLQNAFVKKRPNFLLYTVEDASVNLRSSRR